MGISQLLAFVAPLGPGGALAVLVIMLVIYINKSRISDSRERVELHGAETAGFRREIAAERADREAAEREMHQWRDAAMRMQMFAQQQRLARESERGWLLPLIAAEARPSLPPVPDMPDLLELG